MDIAEMVEEVKMGTDSRVAALNELIEKNRAEALDGNNLRADEVVRLTQKRDGFVEAMEVAMPLVKEGRMFQAVVAAQVQRSRALDSFLFDAMGKFEKLSEQEAKEMTWRREGWLLAEHVLKPLVRLAD